MRISELHTPSTILFISAKVQVKVLILTLSMLIDAPTHPNAISQNVVLILKINTKSNSQMMDYLQRKTSITYGCFNIPLWDLLLTQPNLVSIHFLKWYLCWQWQSEGYGGWSEGLKGELNEDWSLAVPISINLKQNSVGMLLELSVNSSGLKQ